MSTHIHIPDEQAERIKQFARARKLNIPDAVGELINIAVRAGEMPDGVPGFELNVDEDTVRLTSENGYSRVMTREGAKAFATSLRWLSQPKSAKASIFRDVIEGFAGFEVVGLRRLGAGLKMIGDNNIERTIARSVGRDLADFIDRSL